MNILITGAYGFVGTNISQYLSDSGHVLSALDIAKNESDKNYRNFYSWSDFDRIPFDRFDTIIHLAGKAHDTKNKSEAQAYFDINTGLTTKIFDAFLKSNCKQFIQFSSVKAAADKIEGEFLTEDVTPLPIGPYGESKIKAEEYVNSQFSALDSPLKRVYIFRPCMIHGPGNKGNLNLLYQVVSKGIPWPLGAFDNKRSFMNIWNLSWIVEQFITKNPPGGTYHLADDEAVSTNRLIRLIAASKNKKARIWNCNKTLIQFIARCGNALHLPLNSERLQKLTENYVVSNLKMKRTLGIERLPVSVEEGLSRTLNTFK